jgi:predicted nucleic acid-binding protein
MPATDRFIDTNVLLYLFSGEARKADRAEDAVSAGGIVSIQVLNEFAAVTTRKLGMSIAETRQALGTIRTVCKTVPLTEETHDLGLDLAERYQLALFDAMIVASALLAGCKTLVSEDLQHGQTFERRLVVRNPFV